MAKKTLGGILDAARDLQGSLARDGQVKAGMEQMVKELEEMVERSPAGRQTDMSSREINRRWVAAKRLN